MTLFGRDSLITSCQSLPFVRELARTMHRVLAARQGRVVDDFRDEEPGRILHEIRFGELVHFGERPHAPYFGASDTTPLFLVLLDEYERWTGDAELVRELDPDARAALEWIDHYGDRDGDGYVEYERWNTETGLENQCWKDSWNSILYSDGTFATLPRATCEIQGYVDDAKSRSARLARVEAAAFFDYRLPEVFAGYERARTGAPRRVSDRVEPAGVGRRRPRSSFSVCCSDSSRTARTSGPRPCCRERSSVSTCSGCRAGGRAPTSPRATSACQPDSFS